VTILFASADDHLIASSNTASAATGSLIVVAHSGLECLEAVRRSPPDLLILDDHLPWGGADGVLDVLNDGDDQAIAEMPILWLTDDPQSNHPGTLRTYPFARSSCREKLAELIEMFESEGVGSA
jgi:DNA-binding response OmpR family regulator